MLRRRGYVGGWLLFLVSLAVTEGDAITTIAGLGAAGSGVYEGNPVAAAVMSIAGVHGWAALSVGIGAVLAVLTLARPKTSGAAAAVDFAIVMCVIKAFTVLSNVTLLG